MLLNAVFLVGSGVAGGEVKVIWDITAVFWAIVGWALMFTYAELARRKRRVSDSAPPTSTADVEEGHSVQTAVKKVVNKDGSMTVTNGRNHRVSSPITTSSHAMQLIPFQTSII